MDPKLNQIVIELYKFDCKDHHWFEEIGEYDETNKVFHDVKNLMMKTV